MRGHKLELEYEDQIIIGFLSLYIDNTGTGNDNTSKFTTDHQIDHILVLIGMKNCAP